MPWWKAKKSKTPKDAPASSASNFALDNLDEEEIEDEWEEDQEDEYEREEDDKRVMAILGATTRPPAVTRKTLAVYQSYLLRHLTLPCRVTGREDFPWEEKFVFGHGSKREYEQLKKTNPSFKDHFDLLGFEEDFDEFYGILAKIRRVTDQKEFVIGLDWLEAMTEKSPNHLLLEDYSMWFVNYR